MDERRTPVHALVVHSPLVGPSSIRPLAERLAARGWTTTVPDLRGAARSAATFGAAATGVVSAADVVVGHSGAGAHLPAIADALGDAVAVFVDAVVPPAARSFRPSRAMSALLDALPTEDGLLPPWHEWWAADVIAGLVPDDAVRARLIAEIPRLPRSAVDDEVPLPARWWRRRAAFLQLSPAYDAERVRAERWGWPTQAVAGGHLDVCARADVVADHVVALVAQPLR